MSQPNLLEDPVQKLFFRYLFPSISATLVTSIYILADTVMIGRGVGSIGIAALNLLLPVFSLYFGTGMLFGVGGGVLLSISKGRGDEQSAREYFTVAMICTALISLIYLIVFSLFFDMFLQLLGSNPSMKTLVEEYARVLILGAPGFVFSTFLQALVRNDKAPRLSMTAVVVGGISNVILDYIFIFPMGMGMAGAAAASVIGSCITIGILLLHFLSPCNTLKLAACIRMRKAGEIFVNGLASFLIEVSNGIVVFLFNRQLLAYVGNTGVVVYGIISNSVLVVSSISNGISQASQPLLAMNFGAGHSFRVAHTRRLAERTAAAAGFLFLGLGFFCPRLIIGVFVKPDTEILLMAIPAVRIYFLSFLAMGLNVLCATYFQSVMKPACALLICLLRGLVLNGIFVFIMPVVFGVTGIWMTIVAAEFLTLLTCYILKTKQG